MDTTALATSLLWMSAQKTQFSANIAVLKKTLDMQKSVLDILDPASSRAAPAPGTGTLVDKTV